MNLCIGLCHDNNFYAVPKGTEVVLLIVCSTNIESLKGLFLEIITNRISPKT